jgi:hypothetical protein
VSSVPSFGEPTPDSPNSPCAAPPYGSAQSEYQSFIESFGKGIWETEAKSQQFLAAICQAKLLHSPDKIAILRNLGIQDREIDAMTMGELRLRAVSAVWCLVHPESNSSRCRPAPAAAPPADSGARPLYALYYCMTAVQAPCVHVWAPFDSLRECAEFKHRYQAYNVTQNRYENPVDGAGEPIKYMCFKRDFQTWTPVE